MNKQKLAALTECILNGSNHFQHSVYLAKQALPPEQHEKYKELVGIFLIDVLCDVLNPVYKEHPDLKPEGWDDPYVPPANKGEGNG